MTGSTVPYGFAFEVPRDRPGVTLTGGPSGVESPILAEQINDEFERVDEDLLDLSDEITTLQDRTSVLSHVSLSGTVGTGTALTIPADLRGTFRSYVLHVSAYVSESLAPLVVRVNGISAVEYRHAAQAVRPDNTVLESTLDAQTDFPRMGYMGLFGGFVAITFRPFGLGNVGLINWTADGFANQGATGSCMVRSAGRWNGTIQELENFTIRTTGLSSEWVNGSDATLWGMA